MKFTALDALALRFKVVVVANACRGVNVSPGDADRAIAAMRAAGAEVVAEASGWLFDGPALP